MPTTARTGPERLRLEFAAIEIDAARAEIIRLIAEYPDLPTDALLRLIEIPAELERIGARVTEVADRA